MNPEWARAIVAVLVRGLVSFLAFFAAALCALPGLGQEASPRARLIWQRGAGTEGCIATDELLRQVEAQLGREVFARGDEAAATTIHVTLEAAPAPLSFRALVRAESGQPASGAPSAPARELSTSEDCRALDEQLTLVVALLVDSGETRAETAAPVPEPLPEPEPEPAPPKEEVQPLGPVSSAPSWDAAQEKARWGFVLDLGGALGFGVLPNVAYGAELGFLAAPSGLPALRLRVQGLTSQPVEPVPGASVSFLFGMAGLELCPSLVASATFRLRSCLNADLGVIRAKSEGLEGANDTARFVPMLGLALRGTLRIGGRWLGLMSAGASVPMKVDRFVYYVDGQAEVIHEIALLPVFLTLGVAHEFL